MKVKKKYPYLLCNLFNENIICENIHLSKILQRSVVLIMLNKFIISLLPLNLRPWCKVLNAKQNFITLETINSTYHWRLKYELNKFMFSLKKKIMPSLSFIKIKVNPSLLKNKSTNVNNCDLYDDKYLNKLKSYIKKNL